MNKIINYSDNDSNSKFIFDNLEKARNKFGNYNQIMVSVEELCELSSVISKIPRYNNIEDARKDMKEKVVDEVADVLIIMDHIISILDISDNEIKNRIYKKMNRMSRWLSEGEDQTITITDRSV